MVGMNHSDDAKCSEQLLITSQIDQGRLVPRKKAVKLVQLLQEVFADLKTLTGMRNTRWSMPNISDLVSVYTDPKLLRRVLLEIIENAVRYNKPDGVVEIDVIKDRENLRIMVKDHGIGIPEEEKSLIFTKFFRGSNFETTEIEGAGLGLFISKEIMTALGGDVWFEENDDGGMVFWISLPADAVKDENDEQ